MATIVEDDEILIKKNTLYTFPQSSYRVFSNHFLDLVLLFRECTRALINTRAGISLFPKILVLRVFRIHTSLAKLKAANGRLISTFGMLYDIPLTIHKGIFNVPAAMVSDQVSLPIIEANAIFLQPEILKFCLPAFSSSCFSVKSDQTSALPNSGLL